jgi:tetratricopeptide (TPR) repeat protein
MIKYFIVALIIVVGCTNIQTVENKLASEAYNEGKYLTAITYANETLEKDFSNTEALWIRGKSNLKLNNYSDAVLDFTKVMEDRKNFDVYYYRARAYLELNELEKSVSDLNNALEFDSKNVEALFDLGYVETLLGNYDSALDAYKRVINVEPANYKAYVNIGNLKGKI